jgi:hypothetical protein
VIVAKINTQGTDPIRDDRLLRNAHFVIRTDDGDGKYEPDDGDEVVFDGVAEYGFLVFKEPTAGEYWLTEIDAPTGFERARRPTFVTVEARSPTRNCIQVGTRVRCFADEDQSGGFLIVVIPNEPAELPPTDTGISIDRAMPQGPRRRRRRASAEPPRSAAGRLDWRHTLLNEGAY